MPSIIQYRQKCIGCGICYEMMPDTWRMSKKDGKATLLKSVRKKQTDVLPISHDLVPVSEKVAEACPVNIIKIT